MQRLVAMNLMIESLGIIVDEEDKKVPMVYKSRMDKRDRVYIYSTSTGTEYGLYGTTARTSTTTTGYWY
jgi:hypothetical protein